MSINTDETVEIKELDLSQFPSGIEGCNDVDLTVKYVNNQDVTLYFKVVKMLPENHLLHPEEFKNWVKDTLNMEYNPYFIRDDIWSPVPTKDETALVNKLDYPWDKPRFLAVSPQEKCIRVFSVDMLGSTVLEVKPE